MEKHFVEEQPPVELTTETTSAVTSHPTRKTKLSYAEALSGLTISDNAAKPKNVALGTGLSTASRPAPEAILPTANAEKVNTSVKPKCKIVLDSSQREVLAEIMNAPGLTPVVAPPGTGKTMLVATAAKSFVKSGIPRVVIASATNATVMNAMEAILDENHDDSIRMTWMCSKVTEHTISEGDRKFMLIDQVRNTSKWLKKGSPKLDNIAKRISEARTQMNKSNDFREIVDIMEDVKQLEKKATSEFLKEYNPNVVGTTISLLIRHRELDLLKDTTHLIVDDASQIASCHLLAAMCALSKLDRVILIGDPHQLGPHNPHSPRSDIFHLAATSDLERLTAEHPEENNVLRKIYRSNRLLTENVVRHIYPIRVESALTCEERDEAKKLGLPTAQDGTPCVFYNVHTENEDGSSWDEGVAIEQFLCRATENNSRVNLEDFVVLVYHKKQKYMLSELLPPAVSVHTIDGYLGKQAKFVILSVVKNSPSPAYDSIQETFKFVGDPKRTLVALTRATDGLYVFGNMDQLRQVGLYKKLISNWADAAGAIENVVIEKKKVSVYKLRLPAQDEHPQQQNRRD